MLCGSFLTELEKMAISRLMEEPSYMDNLKAKASWSTPKAVYILVRRMAGLSPQSDKIYMDYLKKQD